MKHDCGDRPETDKEQLLEEDYIIRERLKKLNLLETYLSSGQQDEFYKLFKTIASSFSVSTTSISILIEVYYSIAIIFLSFINRRKMELELEKNSDHILCKLMRFEEHTSWDEALKYLLRIAELLNDIKSEHCQIKSNHLVKKIQAYVENNLDKEVSLNRLSTIFHTNPSYLSRTYKQITGKSLKDFIAERKISKAVELLKNTEKSVRDIALVLGFTTASYFSVYFKKYTHMTPTEYRQLQS